MEELLIIKSSIRHYEISKYQKEYLQAINIVVEDCNGNITIFAVYSLSKHIIKNEQYIIFFKILSNGFIAGNYNAKHTMKIEIDPT